MNSQARVTEARRQARNRKAHELAAFMNNHKSAFNPGDEKNAQGLMFIWALHQIQEFRGSQRGITDRAIARFIKAEGMWFKPQIRKEGGQYHGPKPSAECPPYLKSQDGVKQAVLYLPDKLTPRGLNVTTQHIMNQIKSVVVTEKRSHDIIRTLVVAGGEKTYYLELPRPASAPLRHSVRVEVIPSNSIAGEEEISDEDEVVHIESPRVSFLPQQSIPRPKGTARVSSPTIVSQMTQAKTQARPTVSCQGCNKTFTPSGYGLFPTCGTCHWEGSVCIPLAI